jgi:peptidoglycan/xylan/chitin deacetylase (PgdA/CDA1 family)
MYHSVSSSANKEPLKNHLYRHISIDVENFEKQIIYLKKRGHTFISFNDLIKVNLRKINKPTIIYFDDGFKDVVLNAKPTLEKYNIPSTIFLVTGFLDHTDILWTILYKEILTKQGVSEGVQNSFIHKIKTGTERERMDIMRQFPIGEHLDLFDIFLSWQDIRNLPESNFEIGSHGVTHGRLTEYDQKEIANEITHSKERIETETGRKVEAFSLPHGRGSETLVEELNRAGYQFVVSAGKGINKLPKGNEKVFYFRNISPKPDEPFFMFKLRLYSLNIKNDY